MEFTGERIRLSSAAGGASKFTDLTDVDNDYTGDAGKYLKVNATATGIEFAALAGGGDMATATYDPANVNEQLCGTAATQTLANKTLTTPIIATLYQDAGKTKLITFPADSQTLATTANIKTHSDLTAGMHGIAAGSTIATTAHIATHSALTTGIHGLGTMSGAASADFVPYQLIENTPIKLDEGLSADGKYCGITKAGVADAALAFGEVCYLSAASTRWALAKADAAATDSGLLGVCVLAATGAAATTTILYWGTVRADSLYPNLPVGAPVYVSAGTAGQVSGTASAGTTNHVVRIIGHGHDANEMYFHPDNDYIEIA